MKASGKCLCEAVKFEFEIVPNSVVNCHCSLCRRAHGAPFVTWVDGKINTYQITSGEDLLKEYRSAAGAKRTFCSRCGSYLFFAGPRWPEEKSTALAHLDNIESYRPTRHIYYDDRLKWLDFDDGLPKFGGVTGTEPLP